MMRIFLLIDSLLASKSSRMLVTSGFVVGVDLLFGDVLLIHAEAIRVDLALIDITSASHRIPVNIIVSSSLVHAHF